MEDGTEERLPDGQLVATDVCESEFARFCDAMDIDVDPTGMDDDDMRSLKDSKRLLVRAMQRRSLIINENGEPVFTPVGGDEDFRKAITFHEPTGASWMAMDGVKVSHDTKKLFSTMADITHLSVSRFTKMAARDVKICVAITILFLA